MKLLSVNVGLPREVISKGRLVKTGIFKVPVEGRVVLRRLNLEGDRQADLSVHGGPSKAVYAYPAEHYDFWRLELPGVQLPWGMFGENFTTEGLREEAIHVGDRYLVGSAELMVTEPRLPCYKLGVKFGREDIIKRFLRSGRTGFYFAVLREGEVGAGDAIELLDRDEGSVTIPEVVRLYLLKRYSQADEEAVRLAVRAEALPESWRSYFQERLNMASGKATR